MNKEAINIQMIDGIYDIQPLPIPPLSLLEISIATILIVSIISVISYFSWRILYSKKSIARRKINQLHNDYLTDNINSHNAIYQLCFITKEALGLKKLSNNTPLPKKLNPHITQWINFSDNLSTLRYKKSYDNKLVLDHVFSDALFWIKHWP